MVFFNKGVLTASLLPCDPSLFRSPLTFSLLSIPPLPGSSVLRPGVNGHGGRQQGRAHSLPLSLLSPFDSASPRLFPSHSGLAALSYGLASMAMVFLNKGVLTYYKFSMTLLALQMVATTALIYVGGKLEWIAMRPFSLSTARRLLPLSFFYNANVAFALASLQGVNIPMYIALKRLTPMAVLITGFFTGKSKPPLQVTLSVSLTTFGCLIAALGDFSLDPYAYALALTSVLCQTFYLLLVERSGAEQGISSFELMFYNALLSLPFLGAILLCTNELPTSVPLLFTMCAESWTFTVAVTASLVMALVLNYTMFLCTIVNSALTTTIVGVLKGVFTTIFGFFFLGGVKFQLLNVTGLVINSAGGVWYSIAKYRQKQAKVPSSPVLPTTRDQDLGSDSLETDRLIEASVKEVDDIPSREDPAASFVEPPKPLK
ncbi:unnamed protein product [Closterium sp. Yama58-4]|nr:unnamed protein product [Closterium sp. Yama58-4]